MTTFTYKTFTITLNASTNGEPTATVYDNCDSKILKEPKEFATTEEALVFVNDKIERLTNYQTDVFAARIVESRNA